MKKLFQSLGWAATIKISSFFKMSFLIGSQMIWFSASSALVPLIGVFGGHMVSSCVLLMRIMIHALLFKSLSVSFLALCVPGYCASLYWMSRSIVIRAFLPILCMVLFIVHPVGSQAYIYSFYWLIPFCLYWLNSRSLFLEAIGSSFVAHAVGSVIWLYSASPMLPAAWLGLIPIVAMERLLFALSMVVAYKILLWVKESSALSAIRMRIYRVTV